MILNLDLIFLYKICMKIDLKIYNCRKRKFLKLNLRAQLKEMY